MNVEDSKDSGISGVSGSIDDPRSPGLGLLLRFLGAVFLVLVCGLLVLDQALLQANRDQTNVDAQAASLLVESYVAEESSLLDRFGAIVHWQPGGRAELSEEMRDMLQRHSEVIG